MKNDLIILGAITGILSAILWFWSAFTRVTHEQSIARAERRAARTGVLPNSGGLIINGTDLMPTIRRQSSLNAAAAAFSGIAVLLQTAVSFMH